MANGYLTSCALVIAILITIMFIIKSKVKNKETKIFKRMLFINILEALTTTLIVIVAVSINNTMILKLLNRIDVILIITWCSLMFYYIYSISSKNTDKNVKKYLIFLNLIIYFFALFLDVKIINENGIMNSTGPLTHLGLIGASFYILLIILTVFVLKDKNENLDKDKYIPLYFLISMLIIVATLRLVIPEINLISILISLINMIMIFTIENPDIKLLKEIQFAKNQADKANRVKSEFLSSMSHEIRTPINAIYGYSQLIEYADNLEEAKENAEQIKESSEILVKMVSNILDIFKIESNEIKNCNNSYDPYDEFNDLLDLFEDKMTSKNLILERNIMPNLPKLYGDINILKKALINVLDNAIKYTEKGKVIFKVDTNIKNDKCELMIIIEDTGKGINKENLKNIFEYFERGENKDSSINGLGLGLPLTKKLIEMIDGKLEIESVYNKGTKVIIVLEEEIVK